MNTVLGATLHDPVGRTAGAIAQLAPVLKSIFPAITLNISDATRPEVVEAVGALNAKVVFHAANEAHIGRFRRDAVAAASDGRLVLYSDFDHLLRWVEFGRDDLQSVLAAAPDVDCLIVGRSEPAFAAEPQRLRDTERIVNHAHALLTGDQWDLMFAIRRLSPKAINVILRESRVDSLASDVEWPLLIRRAGLDTAYVASDALFYRTIEGFGGDEDEGDADALQWVRRIEFAAQHAAVLRRFMDKNTPPDINSAE